MQRNDWILLAVLAWLLFKHKADRVPGGSIDYRIIVDDPVIPQLQGQQIPIPDDANPLNNFL